MIRGENLWGSLFGCSWLGGAGIFRILESVSGDSLKALGGSFLELYVGL